MLRPDAIATYLDDIRKGTPAERRRLILERAADDQSLREIEQEQDCIADVIIADVPPEKLKAKALALEDERMSIGGGTCWVGRSGRIAFLLAVADSYRRHCQSLSELAGREDRNVAAVRELMGNIDKIKSSPCR